MRARSGARSSTATQDDQRTDAVERLDQLTESTEQPFEPREAEVGSWNAQARCPGTVSAGEVAVGDQVALGQVPVVVDEVPPDEEGAA